MEARIGSEGQRFYALGAPDFMLKEKDWMGAGRKGMEWDLNDWRWDGDLFIARPLNPIPSDCRSKQLFPAGAGISAGEGMSNGTRLLAGKGLSNSSSSCSDEIDAGSGKGKGELEKRRRVTVVEEDELNEEPGVLSLKLGGHVYPVTDADVVNWGERSGKKTKFQGANSSRSVCQVEDCGADLTNAKDYHRRHKVCEAHSKASQALVGNVMQRFCQQCSRFHLIQEFDEGKRSCRRRLAGHNRRRRKSHPDTAGGSSLNDDRSSSYLLISLLRILSNLHSNSSDQAKDQDFLSHLLRNLASHGSTFDESNLSRLLQESQKIGTSVGTSSEAEPALLPNAFAHIAAQQSPTPLCNGIQNPLARPINATECVTVASSGMPQKGVIICEAVETEHGPSTITNGLPLKDSLPSKVKSTVERFKLNNIDLNDIYDDSQDRMEGSERLHSPVDLGTGCFDCPSWIPQDSHHSSPTQPSGNSDSASAQSPSSSNGDAQSRTDRIVFKLFGKDPNEFPLTLRAQILDWLSHSPTDIESYIRPGCIILTIYLRLTESTWKELCCELSSSLHRLLDVSDDVFFTTGWIYARLQHRVAFIYNGQVLLDTPMLLRSLNHCSILSVTPIAVSASERANFMVKGFNLCRSTTRLLCAFDGEYLVQDMSHIPPEDTDTLKEQDEFSCLSFSCSIPNATGRGFIEVEDHGLSSSFFPFIVAEQDVCSEIRMLESAIDVDESNGTSQKRIDAAKSRTNALDFLHEMGWLLRRSHLRSRSDRSLLDVFPFIRFKWLMEFSMDHDWCSVVKKLLDVLFEGTVDAGGSSSVELALSEMGLLHKAVRRNCRPMVELLLKYAPDNAGHHHGQRVDGGFKNFLFRPDALGPASVTPLHIAASRDDTENVLDALTDDPGKVGVEAWKSARDSTGFAPVDYARLRGYFSYIHLVQKKINKRAEARHVVLDIRAGIQMPPNNLNSDKLTGFETEKAIRTTCKVCAVPYSAYSNRNRSLLYRPAMLSMVAIAAVCVCMGLFFHGPPEVLCVFPPFRWEMLGYGEI
ncbi:hypothetical protein MRB53_028954 [Persea americana]|uniref:Uncharacterized protein n=1 Tax=Persea americana TaxID=3435 RepID=A0ACC2KHI5_PERAE|nr:hypothetical protein MRB53_028954 [Persea americana]